MVHIVSVEMNMTNMDQWKNAPVLARGTLSMFVEGARLTWSSEQLSNLRSCPTEIVSRTRVVQEGLQLIDLSSSGRAEFSDEWFKMHQVTFS